MAIWTLETDSDFTTFYFPLEEDKIFFKELIIDYFEEFKPISEKWRTLYMLRTEPKKHTDFFEIDDTDIIAVSQKVVDEMQSFFKEVELLPIETDAGKYYALNVLSFVDCLNMEKSNYVATQNGTVVSYTLLEFNQEKIGDFTIFRLPQLPYRIFITGDIEDQCEQSNLKGLTFDPNSNLVWATD